jgi:hypothetical protein
MSPLPWTRFKPAWKLPPFRGHEEQWLVLLVAVVIAIAAFFCSFFNASVLGGEDAGLFNPVYTFYHYGKMAYPAHLYFDAMVIHPPVQYWEIALLMKLGFGPMRAAGMLVFLPMLLILGLVLTSRFLTAAKLGLMVGAFGIVFVLSVGTTIRPEPHLALAWLAGLIALESGRVEDWNLSKLALGGFLATYAGGLHYWGIPSMAMPLVYAVWVLWCLGWKQAIKPLLALTLGVSLFLVPYLLWFVLPHWEAIRAVLAGVQATGGMGEAIQVHLSIYQGLVSSLRGEASAYKFTSFLVLLGLLTGVPLILIAMAIWGSVPGTRGLAIAGSILPLFVVLGVKRKFTELYLLPELMLYTAGVIMVSILLLQWLAQRLNAKRGQRILTFGLVSAIAVAIFITTTTTVKNPVANATTDFTQAWKVARAAGKEIIGQDALIASTTTITWYTSGASYWYHVGGDVGYPAFQKKDYKAFLAQFDSIPIESGVWFVYDAKAIPIPDWYLNGELYFQGFFTSPDISFSLVYLSAKRPTQVVGYGFWENQLYRFQEQADGRFVNAVFSCTLTDPQVRWNTPISPYARLSTFTSLATPSEGSRFITSFVMTREEYDRELPQMQQRCTVRDLIPGDLQPADEAALVKKLEQRDRPIQFFNNLNQALEARNKP